VIIINTNYLLNFTIPQGPTGPTGPASGLSAYGGKYNTTSQTLNLGIGTQTQLPLSVNMPNLNTSYTQTNSITINQTGTYEINYYMSISAALATTVTFSVRQNGTNIPSTTISKALTVGTNTTYNGSTIVNITSGNTIDMAISALLAVGITLGNGVNASLSIKKLN